MADTARELTEPDAMPPQSMGRKKSLYSGAGGLKVPLAGRNKKKLSAGNISMSDMSFRAVAETRTVHYENSYRTEPPEGTQFRAGAVHKIIVRELDINLNEVKYSRENEADHCRAICNSIKFEVKKLAIPRFKIVVNVMLAENRGQGLVSASRAVWNDKIDNFAYAEYHNDSIVAVAMVHGVYFE